MIANGNQLLSSAGENGTGVSENRGVDLQFLLRGMNAVVPALAVSDISAASRSVTPGGLFLACAGARHHGLEFLDQALASGIAAVAWEPATGIAAPVLPEGVPGIAIPELRGELGNIANRFFDTPSASLAVTGITGTNGKTTTAFLVAQALHRLGQTAAYMGTLGFGIGPDLQPSSMTTPDCITVHRRLRTLLDNGATHVVTEVSSHALDQQRIAGVHIRIAALTNLGRDHLDYHGDLASYSAAKAKLFQRADMAAAVINVADVFGREIAAGIATGIELVSVAAARSQATAGLQFEILETGLDGMRIGFTGTHGKAALASSLWGRFNAENLAMATGILVAHGYPLDDVVAALSGCAAPPGRMQTLPAGPGQPAVLVDFAHTPDGLEQLLSAVRQHCNGRLWLVFGCGGNRDTGKRSAMGSIAAALADRVIVTNDNPRNESPESIVEHIMTGIDDPAVVEIVMDRATAIAAAIDSAGADDVVVIAGKGHETKQIARGNTRAFSDAAVARRVLGPAAGSGE